MANLQKRYANGFDAVSGLDLHVEDGEFLVLLGQSGSGKSTLLRMIAGLESVSDGELLIDGVRVNDMAPQQRGVAIVHQSYALYPNVTVAENIALALQIHRTSDDVIRQRVSEVAGLLELTHVLQCMPGQLSGAQRQRVAMGRAVLGDPRLFLMDEPLSNLDSSLRVHARAEISRLQRHIGVTTVYATQHPVEGMSLGDRVAVLHRGQLMQCAAPAALYETPANLFVAEFIGSPSMNVLKGTVIAGGADGFGIRIGHHDIACSGGAAQRLATLRRHIGREVAVGFRPEALAEDNGIGSHVADNSHLDVTVGLMERLDGELLAHCTIDAPSVRSSGSGVEVGGGTTSTVIASLDVHHRAEVGDRLRLHLDTARLHVFDLSTGAALGTS